MFTSLVKLAGLNVRFNSKTWALHRNCQPYAIEDGNEDIIIDLTEDMVLFENEGKPCDIYDYTTFEITAAFRALNEHIMNFDAFVLHAAVISVDDRAIAFCAKSGTGKTTHMNLWSKLLGDRLKIINGDKPIVRFIDGIPHAYGTPWNGKEHLHTNMSARLTDICFIERSENNSVISVSEKEATQRLSSQLVAPSSIDGMMKNMQFLDGLLKNCNIHIINCNMDISAAETAYNAIFNKE